MLLNSQNEKKTPARRPLTLKQCPPLDLIILIIFHNACPLFLPLSSNWPHITYLSSTPYRTPITENLQLHEDPVWIQSAAGTKDDDNAPFLLPDGPAYMQLPQGSICCSGRKKLIKSQKLIVFINNAKNGEGGQCPLSRETCLLLTADILVLSECYLRDEKMECYL